MRTNNLRRSGAAALTALVLGLTATACGSDDSGSGHDMSGMSSDAETAPNGDVFNEVDVEFATNMIPHHAQAIQMVTLTDRRTLDPEVSQLANEIRAAQAPEVEQMVDWLTAWDKKVPETPLDHANAGHDMNEVPGMEGMEDMPGMMSADEMEALMNAPDSEFQDLWLEMMKEHHEGAIEMAEDEQKNGEFADAIALADTIVTAQKAEIEQIDQLLGS